MTSQEIEYSLGYIRQQKQNPTQAEKEFAELLDSLQVDYVFQQGFWLSDPKGKYSIYIADFYLPDSHAVIEIDGAYHLTARGVENLQTYKKRRIFKRNNIFYLSVLNEDVPHSKQLILDITANESNIESSCEMITKAGIFIV